MPRANDTGISTALSVRDSTQYLAPKNPVMAAKSTIHPTCAVVGIRILIQTPKLGRCSRVPTISEAVRAETADYNEYRGS